MQTMEHLRTVLSRIDGKGYGAYKDVRGSYLGERYSVHIDHVRGDPFAAPSKVRVRVPMSAAGLPPELWSSPVKRCALADFVARQVHRALESGVQRGRGSGRSGLISIDAGGQEVLERSACVITPEWIETRIYVGLPAAGRRVLGHEARDILCTQVPRLVEQRMLWANIPHGQAREHVECVENQEVIRSGLESMGLIAFVAEGSVLPRQSGASSKPLPRHEAIPFDSPRSMRVRIQVPNRVSSFYGGGTGVTGMGIPRGVTLVVGGGYHGKSTLLQALEQGVYPHIPGDGREYVVTCSDAVKIRAEDGRRIERVDISPFITNLPRRLDTRGFRTSNASGSTSQAAGIIEAVEIGAAALLLDEDTSATNFMVRDLRMQELVHKEFEPITPFIDRVHELYETLGVSTVLVMGGCGDYFDAADTVIMMRDYLPVDVTVEAREVASRFPTGRLEETGPHGTWRLDRRPLPDSFDPSRGRKRVKIDAVSIAELLYGSVAVDLRGVEQLVERSQTRAVGMAVHYAAGHFIDGRATLKEVLERLDRFMDEEGLDRLDPFHRPDSHPGSFARPRRHEVGAAINRLRTVRMRRGDVPR